MRIGFYGGTFDPIHFGHINLAIQLKEQHKLDEIWFCPAYISPFKQEQSSASALHRMNMTCLGIESIPDFYAIDTELRRQETSFTIDTIHTLIQEYPHANFFLLLGNDILPTLHLWKNVNELLHLCPPLIGQRTKEMLNFEGSIELLDILKKGMTPTQVMEIDATSIRKRIKNNSYCGHLLPAKVLDYIYQEQLYSNEDES